MPRNTRSGLHKAIEKLKTSLKAIVQDITTGKSPKDNNSTAATISTDRGNGNSPVSSHPLNVNSSVFMPSQRETNEYAENPPLHVSFSSSYDASVTALDLTSTSGVDLDHSSFFCTDSSKLDRTNPDLAMNCCCLCMTWLHNQCIPE